MKNLLIVVTLVKTHIEYKILKFESSAKTNFLVSIWVFTSRTSHEERVFLPHRLLWPFDFAAFAIITTMRTNVSTEESGAGPVNHRI